MSERRQFLHQSLKLLALTSLSLAFPGQAENSTQEYPFTLGVASGSARADSVVLWTRVLTEPLAQQLSTATYKLQWQIAHDEQFKHIVQSGHVFALPELAHSVHVDVKGLQPARWYWYRFILGDAVSLPARTRTAPAAHDDAQNLRFAVASCQHWEFGEYAAQRQIALSNPDLIVFLGDYIYEWGPYDSVHPDKPRGRNIESRDLHQYRRRYAQYKADDCLQMAHAAAPWLVTWDDHEVANDYAFDHDERLQPEFMQRRAAAYQAFYEHMPVRLNLPETLDFTQMRIYDQYDWGNLARFHLLDSRQYRNYQACSKPGLGGSNVVSASQCKELNDPGRSLLGWEQEQWLLQSLTNSKARWNILAQQTLMAQCSTAPIKNQGDGRFWTDGWDGYPQARKRLFDDLLASKARNPVVISGDVHTFYAAELCRNFYAPISHTNPIIATEFCGSSVTSSSRPQSTTDKYLQYNPQLKYGRSDVRGFMLFDLAPRQMQCRFLGVDELSNPHSSVSVLRHFLVADGYPGLSLA